MGWLLLQTDDEISAYGGLVVPVENMSPREPASFGGRLFGGLLHLCLFFFMKWPGFATKSPDMLLV